AAPIQAFAGKNRRFVAVGDALVLAEKIAELARAHADVARRNVGVLAEMAVKFGHETLAKAHHFFVGFAFRVEIRAAFAAADGHSGERVFENLLETEKLDNAEIHRFVKAQPAFIRAQRGVELDAKTAINVYFAFVVLPRHAENNLPFGLADSVDDFIFKNVRAFLSHRPERAENFENRLVKFAL